MSYIRTILLFTLCTVQASVKPSNNVQKTVLQNAVKVLLDFDKVPEPNAAIRPISKTANAASTYMRQLFAQYQQRDGKPTTDNIVRSINPSLGRLDDVNEELVFDLEPIKSKETIMRVELHFNLRFRNKPSYKYKNHKRMKIQAVARVICDDKNLDGDELALVRAGPRWLGFDVRQVLLAAMLMSSSCKTSPKIGVVFSHQRRGRDKEIRSEVVLRRHTPFLLVHSFDPALVDEEMVSEALYVGEATARKGVNDIDDYKSSKYGRPKRESGYYSYSTHDDKDMQKMEDQVVKFQKGGPGRVLDSRKQMRRRRRKHLNRIKQRKNSFSNPKSFGDFGKVEETYDSYSTLGDSRKEANGPEIVLLDGDDPSAGACGRHSLSVKFRDIGWENWIIAPKSFEAHYCAGQCTFPLKSEVRPSNHAYVQSIIHAIGLVPGVPRVCCAPDKMDSLSVLYFDQNDNVVLKNYPRMSVAGNRIEANFNLIEELNFWLQICHYFSRMKKMQFEVKLQFANL